VKARFEPEVELARNYELSEQDLSRVLPLVVEHEQEITDAWQRHFDHPERYPLRSKL
jgi:hypothetical protein